MKRRKLGLDELMIINPSPSGGASMLYQPLHGPGLGFAPGSHPGLAEDYAQYPEYAYAGVGQYPETFAGGYGQYGEAEPGGYAQYVDDPMGYYDDPGMEAYPEDEMGYCGQYPEESMDGYGDGELYDPDMGACDQYPEDLSGYGDYASSPLDGYYREVPPPFNPRGDFGDQLSGYQAEKTVNPTCAFERQAQVTPAGPVPAFFKPYF